LLTFLTTMLAECNAPWPALLTTTWTDNCGVDGEISGSVVSDAGVNVIVDACIQTRLYTFTVTDDCGNVATQTVTVSRKYDETAPVIVDIPDYMLAECNAPWPALLTTTWTDNCGVDGEISGSVVSDGGVNIIVDACIQTRLYTFTVTDDCGNVATQTVTVSRKYDETAPVIVDIADYQLAECNAPWPALLTTTWTDNCGVDGQISGSVVSDGGVNIIVDACIQTRLYTFTVTDDCGNVATQTVTVSRKYDETAPVIVDIPDYMLAECNAPWPALLTTTWTDNCGVDGEISGSVSDAGVNVIVDACIQTRLYTFTVTDDCGNVATQTVTVSRKYDETAPVIVDIPDYMLAECNAPWPALLTTTWTDNCGVDGEISGSVVSDGGVNIIVDACIQTRLYTFTVTDDCGNVATQTVTVSRKYDETAPVIVDIPDYMLAECNAPWPALLTTTWTDNCGVDGEISGSVVSDGGVNIIVDACIQTRLYTFTVTDDCGNVATQTVTVSRKYDETAPVIVDIPDYMLAECNAPWPALLTTTWTDNCGVDGEISGSVV
jgi:lipoprotein-anchoring transpeptidase ErfK/SrfK